MTRNKKYLAPIHLESKNIMPKYNPYAAGYGIFEDKSKKRAYRKANDRKIIKEYVR